MSNPATSVIDRLSHIDFVRGVALLGILLLNVWSFGMPFAAYQNPNAWGGTDPLNRFVFEAVYLLGSMKFMAMFSMLFGVGLILQSQNTERVGRAGRVHVRRMLILFFVGLSHGYLLWHGDILHGYAIAGLIVFWMRSLAPGFLIPIGASAVILATTITASFGFLGTLIPEVQSEMMASIQPTPIELQREVETMRGSWVEQFPVRLENMLFMHALGIYFFPLHNGGLMLVGMGLYKLGFFAMPSRLLGLIAVGCLSVGYGAALAERVGGAGSSVVTQTLLLSNINTLFAPIVGIGYLSLAIVAFRTFGRRLTWPVEAVGRSALSCYLMQTLICTTLFYGQGLGWFGSVDRAHSLMIVAGVWAIQLTLAGVWMSRFRFGPAEWVWRGLTYGKFPAIRKTAGDA
jgi:uncharacterized protein